MGAFTSAVLAATAVAGTAMNVYGQYKAGVDAKEAANYNADIYRKQAEQIEVKKKMTAQEWDRALRLFKGKGVSAVASSGYDYSGSFLSVMKDGITQIRLDKAKELYNLQKEKEYALSGAERSREAGSAAYSSGLTGSIGTLLTEGNEWYMKYGKLGTKTA